MCSLNPSFFLYKEWVMVLISESLAQTGLSVSDMGVPSGARSVLQGEGSHMPGRPFFNPACGCLGLGQAQGL